MENRMIDNEKTTFSQALASLAKNFCIGFTLLMLFSMAAGMIFASEDAKAGIIMCWELAGVMLAAALFQMIFFTPVVIKRMNYAVRLVLFGICLYALLVACGVGMNWFPTDEPAAWASFTVTYLVILAVMTIIFTAIYKRSVKELNEHLSAFKAEAKEHE